MTSTIFKLSVLNTLLLTAFTTYAQDSKTAAEVSKGELPTVYVTAERQVKQQLGASVITAQDIQRNPVTNDLSEIVSKMPGVNMSSNSPGGERVNKRQIDIRSMGPENTLILIDGKPVTSRNAERYGRSGVRNTRGDSNWVPAEMVEKIEVLRGPAAARYGSGAMGGVVNIVTKGISDEVSGSVGIYADHPQSDKEGATRRANFVLSAPLVKDTLGLRVYGNLNKTQADAFDINDSVKSSRTALSAGREGVRNKDIAGRLQWNITPDQKLIFDTSYSRQGNIYNGDTQSSNVLVAAIQPIAQQLIGRETARLYRQGYTLTHKGKWNWGNTETYLSYDKTVNSRLPEGLLGSTEGAYNATEGFTDSILKNYRFGSRADFSVNNHTVTVGTEANRAKLDDTASMTANMRTYGVIPWLANSGRSGKGAQTEYALYVEDNIALNGGKTFLTPALRWDRHSVSGSAWTPSLNFSHAFNPVWKIKGGIARAYKAPNLYQSQPNYLLINASNGCPIDAQNHWNNPNALTYDSGNGSRTNPYTNNSAQGFDWGRACYFLGNKNIKPETSLNKEIGFEFSQNGYLASLAYFHNDYRNRIVDNGQFIETVNGNYDREIRTDNTPDGTPIYRNYKGTNVYRWGNGARAIISGLEGNLTLPLLDKRLTMTTNFTYMHKNEDRATKNPVSIVPKYTINSTLNWRINDSWDVNASYTRYGRQVTRKHPNRFMDVIYNSGESIVKQYELGSYGIFGLNAGYNWQDKITVRAGVNNLFNKKILRTAGTARTYNERGRSYYLSARYSF